MDLYFLFPGDTQTQSKRAMQFHFMSYHILFVYVIVCLFFCLARLIPDVEYGGKIKILRKCHLLSLAKAVICISFMWKSATGVYFYLLFSLLSLIVTNPKCVCHFKNNNKKQTKRNYNFYIWTFFVSLAISIYVYACRYFETEKKEKITMVMFEMYVSSSQNG